MTAPEILALAEAHGVTIRPNGADLDLVAARKPDPDLLSAIAGSKAEIVALLRAEREDVPLPARSLAIFEATARARPPDVSNDRWETALRGLRAFLANGHGDEALRLDWSKDEVFSAPEVWSRVDQTGAALMIGDGEVTEVTSTRIGIRTASGAPQGFYRKPAPDFALAFRERLRLAGEDGRNEEVRLRALEAVVNLYSSHHPGADIDTAKAAVLAAIERSSSSPGEPAR
jgi:hypothetical protein